MGLWGCDGTKQAVVVGQLWWQAQYRVLGIPYSQLLLSLGGTQRCVHVLWEPLPGLVSVSETHCLCHSQELHLTACS